MSEKRTPRVCTVTIRDTDLDRGQVDVSLVFDPPLGPNTEAVGAVEVACSVLEHIKDIAIDCHARREGRG